MHYQALIDGQCECLANMNVVKRLLQVVHRVVVDIQLGYLVELSGACFGLLKVGRGDAIKASRIDLTNLIGLVDGLQVLIEGEDNLRQLRLGAVVVGIRYEDDVFVVGILRYFEGTIAAALSQVVGEVLAVLVNQALLDYIGARVRQSVEEVSRFLVRLDDDGVRIGRQKAVVNDRFDLASDQLIRVFDERQIDRS